MTFLIYMCSYIVFVDTKSRKYHWEILTSRDVFGCGLAEIWPQEGLDLKPVITSWGQVMNPDTVSMEINLVLQKEVTCEAISKLKKETKQATEIK